MENVKTNKPKLCFIGLGVMGFPMAGHLASAGYEVTVYNRTIQKVHLWLQQFSGRSADTPAGATKNADIVFTCVGNDDDLRQVTESKNGAFSGMKAGSMLVDHTTASAKIARYLGARAGQLGIGFIDAPVSGGQVGAEKGTLAVMCGGSESNFNKVEPIIRCYGKTVSLMGSVGCGQLTKMVNQICIGGLVEALAEGINFAMSAGLDAKKVLEVISKGAAQSWQMENRGITMIENKFDFGFAVDWMRKDLAICLEEARNNGAQLPVTALVDQFYAEIQALGGKRWDTSSLIKRLRR